MAHPIDVVKMVITTDLPSDTDEEIEAHCDAASALLDSLEVLIEHWFSPGAAFARPHYLVTLVREGL